MIGTARAVVVLIPNTTTTNKPLLSRHRSKCSYKWLTVRTRARNRLIFELRQKGEPVNRIREIFDLTTASYNNGYTAGRKEYESERWSEESMFFRIRDSGGE